MTSSNTTKTKLQSRFVSVGHFLFAIHKIRFTTKETRSLTNLLMVFSLKFFFNRLDSKICREINKTISVFIALNNF